MRTAVLSLIVLLIGRTAPAARVAEPALRQQDLEVGYARVGGKLFRGRPKAQSVRQGPVGSCHLLSSVAAIAATDRDAITRMFQHRSDGNVRVELFRKTKAGYRTAPVLVTPAVPVVPETGHRPKLAYASSRRASELWPSLVEKAYAKLRGGYDRIDGGYVAQTLSALTGRPTVRLGTRIGPEGEREAYELIARALRARRPVVVSTPIAEELDRQGLTPAHAYAVLGLKETNGARRAILFDPLAKGRGEGVFTMRLAELVRVFEDVVTTR